MVMYNIGNLVWLLFEGFSQVKNKLVSFFHKSITSVKIFVGFSILNVNIYDKKM